MVLITPPRPFVPRVFCFPKLCDYTNFLRPRLKIDPTISTTWPLRANRAIFTKLRHLFRL